MASNSNIKVDELNFSGIKKNLKAFLKGQEQFKDYDFEGSNLSVLVDMLAYNTYYNAIYNNLALNESFLDSASKRASVVSISKMLGYLPRSTRSARATVNVSVTFISASDARTQLVLPKYTTFISSINDTNYYFLNLEERVAIKNEVGSYVFENLELTEGRSITQKFVVAPGTRYILQNENIDTSTIKVFVNESTGTGDPVTFTQNENVVMADSTSPIYFIGEIENGQYELTFGDGIIGKKLNNGNLITVEYIVSSGADSNMCKAFTTDFSGFASGAKTLVTTVTSALGGDAVENISSVKFNAPRSFFTQNRAVTSTDFASLITNNFANASSVHVWGGEDNVPPVYGKVFICVRPKNATFLSEDEREKITSLLKQKSVITSTIEIIDPTYLNIAIDSVVYYNPKATSNSADAISGFVKTTVENYNQNELKQFGAVFKQSKLSRLIDMTEKSITSNVTTVKLKYEVTPKIGTNAQYVINLGNPIYTEGVPEKAVLSSGFYLKSDSTKYYLRDDGVSKMLLCYEDGSVEVVANANVGSVDYKTGIVTINNLNISYVEGTAFEFTIKPQSYDVVSLRNNVLNIPSTLVTVSTIVDATGAQYQFTSSRS